MCRALKLNHLNLLKRLNYRPKRDQDEKKEMDAKFVLNKVLFYFLILFQIPEDPVNSIPDVSSFLFFSKPNSP